MSWSLSLPKPVLKEAASAALAELPKPEVEAPAMDQIHLAKDVARKLLVGIPGPYVMVSLNGHANGVGWQKKEGWANDCISVTVTQMCEEDIPKGATS